MRVSIPTIPQFLLERVPSRPPISAAAAIERVADFIRPGNVTVLTGAGVSVDSGIRAYRGKDGRYMNPNYKPILYHQLVDRTEKGFRFRQRYWLRSLAIQAISHVWDEPTRQSRILELHGTLHKVSCSSGHVVDRQTFQDWLADANPKWKEFMAESERTGIQPRTNPDGDVALEGVSYDDFVVPDCPTCFLENKRNCNHKPHLIFFGESIPQDVKDRSFTDIECGDRLLMIGTTLATFSAFRLLKRALEQHKPVMLLNVGPTRADDISEVEKVEIPTGTILRQVVAAVLGNETHDPAVTEMLRSGVFNPPSNDSNQ
ncbi:sirtuin family protein [Pleurotus pulmonarius]